MLGVRTAWEIRMASEPLSDLLDALRKTEAPDLSAHQIATLLHLRLEELIATASAHDTSQACSESLQLQAVLHDLLRVFSVAALIQPDRKLAISLIRDAPLPAFRGKTTLQLVAERRTEDALDYLESIRSGAVG